MGMKPTSASAIPEYRAYELTQDVKCPTCEVVLDGCTGVRPPKHNDVTVCVYCTSFLIFEKGENRFSLRLLTLEEIGNLPDELRSTMIRLRETFKEANIRHG